MTDKSDFDWWINRDRDTCNVPCAEPIAGTTSAIREQLWFRWSSPSELRDKVIEIVACYPNRSLESENEDRLESIWDRAAPVLSEQVSIEHDDVPKFVRDGLVEELKRVERRQENDTSLRTLRWQHPAGFRCFLNRGVPEWSASCWKSAIDFEGVLQAPTAIECRVLQRIAQECGNQTLSDAIMVAYSFQAAINDQRQTAAVEHARAARTVRRRSRDLATQIRQAQGQCTDPYNTSDVFMALREMALHKVKPFFGVTEDGLQWMDGDDRVQILSKENLRDRLRRQNNAS